jgi:hypothetical protein
MFEIGSSLREARMRQELELSQAERDTRIRAKYLGALEDERFDVLPGPAYTKGLHVRGLPRSRRAALRGRVQHAPRPRGGCAEPQPLRRS